MKCEVCGKSGADWCRARWQRIAPGEFRIDVKPKVYDPCYPPAEICRDCSKKMFEEQIDLETALSREELRARFQECVDEQDDMDYIGICQQCGEINECEADSYRSTCPSCGRKALSHVAELGMRGLL